MPDYYQILNVSQDATIREITQGYHKQVKIHHPDRPTGNTEAFLVLQEAYETLKDREKRSCYDARLLRHSGESYLKRFEREGVVLRILIQPHRLNHYEYYNELFRLQGKERLEPGKPHDINYLWEKIDYLSQKIQVEMNRIQRKLNFHPKEVTDEERKKHRCIHQNITKIGTLQLILFSCQSRRQLYDLSLGVATSDKLRDIEQHLGGRAALGHAIKRHPDMNFTSAVFALYDAGLLTPDNFNQIIQPEESQASHISYAITSLTQLKSLNQNRFDLLLRHKQYALPIDCGLGYLAHDKITNEAYIDSVIRAGKHAKSVGFELSTLNDFGILNDTNWRLITKRIPGAFLYPHLNQIKQAGELTPQQTAALMWKGPKELKPLNCSLDELFAYGLFLLTCAPEKGKEAMRLALQLKSDLQTYAALDKAEQTAQKMAFGKKFLDTLHSKDEIMSKHRAYWKVVAANILVALTGIGFIAVAANYFIHGHGFFAHTRSFNKIAAVELAFNDLKTVDGPEEADPVLFR